MSSTPPSTSPKTTSTPPSTSPPRTPVDLKQRPSSSTPTSDDSSIIDDLSFDYVFDSNGEYVRLSKGSTSKSNNSSPPTPQDNLPIQPDPPLKSSTPPILRRASLSRSESAYPVLTSTSASQSDAPAPRSFQRVASGPALSSNKARPFPRRVTLEESNKHRLISRSARATDVLQHEKENILTEESEHDPAYPARILPSRTGYVRSGTHLDPHQRQILPGPNRAGRVMKPTVTAGGAVRFTSGIDYVGGGTLDDNHHDVETDPEEDSPQPLPASSTPFPSIDPIPEANDGAGSELVEPLPSSVPSAVSAARQRSYAALPSSSSSNSARETTFPKEVALTLSTGTRPRRSASLSDALSLHDAGYGYHQQQQQLREQYQSMRQGTATGDNTGGARRITLEEKEREKAEYNKKYRRDAEEDEGHQAEQDRYYDSQYHNQPQHVPAPAPIQRSAYGHKRRDSDTLRSMPMSAGLGSPTVMEAGSSSRAGGISPSGSRLGRSSPPSARVGRVSPPVKVSPPNTRVGRVSPPGAKVGRVSPPAARLGRVSPAPVAAFANHRRSPTAPETIPLRENGTGERANVGKTRAAAGGRDDEHDHNNGGEQERARERRPPPPQPQQQQQPRQYRPAQPPPTDVVLAPTPAQQLNRQFWVNKKPYARLDVIGKGGSSRVFRVLSHSNEIYAIKRVSLDKSEPDTMSGYMNEIALLKRLEGNSRIIRLIDSEVKAGADGSRGYLMLVMECGEVDLARLISERAGEPLNMVWVAYYWQQMMQAVHVIHEEKIVHSDLKPANFVVVRGQLKLIDFGIANAIANDTTNIQRDHQIGTVNYMSPEAIELPDGMRRLKVGRPSDVWSLGCILYQMVYGQPPFQHLSVYQKMKAIPDLAHIIDFPEYSIPLAPAPRPSTGGNGVPMPSRRLEHLKRKVRSDVIESMQSCLCRNAKERATIPELLDQDWLAMKEPEPPVMPTIKELLAPDETVINPYYMRQLLEYGIKLGAQNADMSPEALLREAERLVGELKSIQ
ncbi:Serine/threonine-protein kinase mph1 [Hypsizygus marmoreus]|uniref:Serine/threonine-protein kinase mph1 n=1 Tax=Hypsizygus marmoreus TaxID=39966 RepID=A0A369JC02_HYPMA|nr:Serine/threonine-protein kinase mph1 [Hypsizygus marmoreus]